MGRMEQLETAIENHHGESALEQAESLERAGCELVQEMVEVTGRPA